MSGINEGSDIYEGNSGGGVVDSVVAGNGIYEDNTDPQNPVVSADLTPGTDINLVNLPGGSIQINSTAGIVDSIVAGSGISVNSSNPENPVVSANLAAGSNVSLATLPGNVIEISAAPGGVVDTITAGAGIEVQAGDPANLVIASKVAGFYNILAALNGLNNTYDFAQIGQVLDLVDGSSTTPEPGWNVARFAGSNENTALYTQDILSQLNAKYSVTSGIPFMVFNQGTAPMKIYNTGGTFNGAAGPYILQAKSTLLMVSGSATDWICQQIGPIADNLREITLVANAGTWDLNFGWSAFPSATFSANTTITIANPQRGKMSLYVTQDTVVRDLTLACNGVTFVVGGSNVVGSNSVTIGTGEFTGGSGARYVINLDFVSVNTCWIVVNH